MHHLWPRLLTPSQTRSYPFRIRAKLWKAIRILLLILCSTTRTAAQESRASLTFRNGYRLQTLQIKDGYIWYRYAEDGGRLQRKGQARISDLNLADATVGGGPDVFSAELKCKDGLKCLSYTWVDTRVEP